MSLFSRRRFWSFVMCVLAAGAGLAPVAVAQDAGATPDAVIERWDQRWTLRDDGSREYHEVKHVRLNHDRAYGDFADPRITFVKGVDKVDVLVARVKRPDGSYVETPDYSKNEVAAFGAAGWPAFANLRQLVLTMSGIEPGCVVELEFKVTSPPGARKGLFLDVPVADRYPIRQRGIGFRVPRDTFSHSRLLPATGGESGSKPEYKQDAERKSEFTYALRDLAGVTDEPQSLPWSQRCGRICLSSWMSPDEWLAELLGRIESAADRNDLVNSLATDWTKDRSGESDKLRAIQEKLAATFNFVDFNVAWRPEKPRPASVVLDCNYGLPEETAALLLSLARAAGVAARPAVLLSDDAWQDATPQDGFVAAHVVLIGPADEPQMWHPRNGRLTCAEWGSHTLMSLEAGKAHRLELMRWTNADDSVCDVRGRISVNASGDWSGRLSLKASGLFCSDEALRTADQQRGRVEALVRRVLPDAKIASHSVTRLTPDDFAAEVDVASSRAVETIEGIRRLLLAQDGPASADVGMPLGRSVRRTPVRLKGAFEERVELSIEWPAEWKTIARPIALPAASGSWGHIEQTLKETDHGVTMSRRVRVNSRDVPAADFTSLRTAINELRAEAARCVAWKAE